MYKIPRNIGYNDLATLYDALQREGASTAAMPVSFPEGGKFGMAGLLIQWIAAWARSGPDHVVSVSGVPIETVLANLAEEPHGCAALYFASGVSGVRGADLSPAEARKYLIPGLKAMQGSRFRDTNGSRGVHLCCYQGAVNEFLLPLYGRRSEDSLRDSDGFLTLTKQILESFEPLAVRAMAPEQLEYLATLVEELFSNTHDHARVDQNGVSYPSGNVRGIFARTFEQRARVNDSGRDLGPLGRYLTWQSTHRKLYKSPAKAVPLDEIREIRDVRKDAVAPRATRFLEITIYDAGPGLARRWASQHVRDFSWDKLSIEDEANYVKACFQAHATTKRSRGFGQGLSSSLHALKALDAFMSLRTGRLFLYQDFSRQDAEGFAPKHWNEESPQLPDVPGASYTVAIPLARAKK